MSLQSKTPEQHLNMCGQNVYGLVDDKIDELQITRVSIQQDFGAKPLITYVLKSTTAPFAEYSISPLNVFESVDDLLTQMAADYANRRKKSKKQ